MSHYTELQLDALRELANIGSGNASTALSGMLGRSVDISVPNAQALPLAQAVDAAGPAEQEITGIVLGIVGEMHGTVLLLVPPADADKICRMLGALVASVLAGQAHAGDIALMLDSNLVVEDEDCSISFFLVPDQGGVDELLSRLGLS